MPYEAIYTEPNELKPDKNILKHPELKIYIENWHHQKGDYGLILTYKKEKLVQLGLDYLIMIIPDMDLLMKKVKKILFNLL